jgi:polysaccharide export outer membrane protein
MLRSILFSCLLPAAVGQTSVADAPSATQPAREQQAPPDSAYQLESGDVVDIRFFYNEELNTKAQIRPDGTISMPLLGEIVVRGSTIRDLTEILTNRYRSTIRNPAMTIQVEGFANRKVFVGGEVMRPGVLPLVGEQTLLGAIFEAGGFTRAGNRKDVTVLRRSPTGTVESITVSLRGTTPQQARTRTVGEQFLLRPLDVVVVHESGVGKANRVVDQYIRQMIPVLLTGGFTYLFNGTIVR